MRPGGSKSKGSGFERQVCRDLSLWLSYNDRDDLYWRSAMSGGRASVKFKKGGKNLTQTGDISAIDPLGDKLTSKFLIECKAYRDLQMVGLYTGIKSGIHVHWQECVQQAKNHKKWPMLIAKQNQISSFVGLDQNGINFFGLEGDYLAYFREVGVYILWFERFLLWAKRP